jgi:hypothetical protein
MEIIIFIEIISMENSKIRYIKINLAHDLLFISENVYSRINFIYRYIKFPKSQFYFEFYFGIGFFGRELPFPEINFTEKKLLENRISE